MTAEEDWVTLLDDVKMVNPPFKPAGMVKLPFGITLVAEEERLIVVPGGAFCDSDTIKLTEPPAVTVLVEAVNAVMVGVPVIGLTVMVWVWGNGTPPRLAVMTALDDCVKELDEVRTPVPVLEPAGMGMLPPGSTLLAEESR